MRRLAGAELGFGAAFVEDSRVVVALVGVGKFLEDFFDFAVTVADAAEKLIGDGEAQQAKSELLLGVDGKNIAANRFGFFGLVEIAVEFGFSESFGDACAGDGFELVVHEGLRDRHTRRQGLLPNGD